MSYLSPVADSGAEKDVHPKIVVEDDGGHRWLISVSIMRVGERMEVVGMEVRSWLKESEDIIVGMEGRPPAKLHSGVWRSAFSFKEILRDNYLEDLEGLLQLAPADVREAWERKGPRRAKSSAELVAQIYKFAHASGENPADVLAEQLQISRSAALKRIQRARADGHLPPARLGRPPKNAQSNI